MSEAATPPAAPAIPEYLKKYMATAEAPAASSDADSMASSSMSIPRISLKAKKFRWIDQGEEVKAEPVTHGVILAVEPEAGKFVKTYYDGPYSPGDTSPPTCTSSDGVRPDQWVTTPQNDLCATCKWNVFGSATSLKGKKAKKCRDSKRLWMVMPEAIDGTVFGLNTPVTSLGALSDLGKKIKETGLPLSAAVIKMSMHEDESFPIVLFELAGWLNEKSGEEAIARNQAKNWQGVLKELNPPVQTALLNKPASAPSQSSQPTPGSTRAPPSQGTTIEGEHQPAKSNDMDAVLKTWGN